MSRSRDTTGNGTPQSAWGRFWFQPSDPTTLAFMRIITGLLVLYVHLAYCFDFQAFFGRNALVRELENRHEAA